MKLYELRSKKTGKVSILPEVIYKVDSNGNETEEIDCYVLEKLKSLGILSKFTVLEVKPIISMIPKMKIEPEIKIKIKTNKK